jgi:hypothetical protein
MSATAALLMGLGFGAVFVILFARAVGLRRQMRAGRRLQYQATQFKQEIDPGPRSAP